MARRFFSGERTENGPFCSRAVKNKTKRKKAERTVYPLSLISALNSSLEKRSIKQ